MSDYPEFENKMKKTCEALTAQLATIRAGRANAAVLDQIQVDSGKRSFGPLPLESKLLLGALALCWLGMGIYVISDKLKKKKP